MFADVADKYGPGTAIVLFHCFVLVPALVFYTMKSGRAPVISALLNGLGVLSVPLTFGVFVIVMSGQHQQAEQGNVAAWFIIFSAVTGFILPLITLTSSFLTGRLIGRSLYHAFRGQKPGGVSGSQGQKICNCGLTDICDGRCDRLWFRR